MDGGTVILEETTPIRIEITQNNFVLVSPLRGKVDPNHASKMPPTAQQSHQIPSL